MFDRRTLIAQHQSIIQEALDQIKSMKAALKAGKITSSVSVYCVPSEFKLESYSFVRYIVKL